MGMQVLRKPDGGSRGFGFVTYKDEISVEKCLVMLHQLNGKTVELKRAIKKEDMAPGAYSAGTPPGGVGGGYSGEILLPSMQRLGCCTKPNLFCALSTPGLPASSYLL